MDIPQVIIVGGGLSGLSAAHTALENGFRVFILDKSAFMGGNSTKATSGINGSETQTQKNKGIKDTNEIFFNDTKKSARDLARDDLIKALTYNSGSAVNWLQQKFSLDLSLVSRLGGHSMPRTHRGKERFPGMTITYALMEAFEKIAKEQPNKARVLTKAKVVQLLTEKDASGAPVVCGVKYEKDGTLHQENGVVVLATGGYAADFSKESLLMRHRPELAHLPTTNGDHCTGDGIKLAEAIGADSVDMKQIQVHPTGLVDLKEPNSKLKFLAAEALRGCGALLLDKDGNRFADELGHRDYVTGRMWTANNGPYRLVLNGNASKEIEWHCKHYVGRGLMKKFSSGEEVAKEMNIPAEKLQKTFEDYNAIARGEKPCPFGKKFFDNAPFQLNDSVFHVAIVTPVLHYTMGGLAVDPEGRVLDAGKKPLKGLWAAGEVMGGVHGANRLGGNSLLDCVVFGRLSGNSVGEFLRTNPSKYFLGSSSSALGEKGLGSTAKKDLRVISLDEVAKHNKEEDCWVVVNGEVLDVTKFMHEHPGGKKAILLFAGRDATDEFNMIHKPEVVEKYAPETVIGRIEGGKTSSGKDASAKKEMGSFSVEEVKKHSTEKDGWIIIRNKVYDVTKFLDTHPGGKKVLVNVLGKDATEQFEKFHNAEAVLKKYDPKLCIGTVQGAEKEGKGEKRVVVDNDDLGLYGEMIPFGDPYWYQGLALPKYYNESHKKFRNAVRKFTEEEIMPNVYQWEESKSLPRDLFLKAAKAGVLQGCVYIRWLDTKYAGSKVAGDIRVEDFDAFHYFILLDEVSRAGSGGVLWGLFGGLSIGLPPVYHYGTEALKNKVLKSCLSGEKSICLCITEPSAGSDVANLQTTAVLSPCKKFYIVNGEKKWITNGVFSDFFTVAVRTGGKGMGGISLLLLERGMKGLETKQMQCMGVWASGTTYVTMEDVKVPVENLIGKENEGFKYIMSNFNYERMGFLCQSQRFSRVCYEEAYRYANKRKTFGKLLIEHAVIRFKLAEMARQIEAYYAQVEQVCYQLNTMKPQEAAVKLAGIIALAKVQGTKTFEYCAREAAQIFGGLSYSRGGQGEKVERLYRDVRAYAIPGGSEEIMLDLGLKQMEKYADKVRGKAKM